MVIGPPPPHPPGLIWMDVQGDGTVLHMRGEIDAATVAAFEDHADGDTTPMLKPPIVAVDAQAVTFMNSSAVTFLVRQYRALRRLAADPRCVDPRRWCDRSSP